MPAGPISNSDKSKLKQPPLMNNESINKPQKPDHLDILHDKGLQKRIDDYCNTVGTEAGQMAMNLADKTIDGEPCISAEKWNAFVAEQFPHIKANPVKNHISVVDAMNSISTYMIREQAAQKADEKAALEAKSQEEGGGGKAPDMGV